jgi:hypothetical protein
MVVLLVTVLLLVASYTVMERVRRTAEAPVEVVLLDSHARPGYHIPGGIEVQYRFVADGVTYEFFTFRSWGLETIRNAKVCYDPADPRNQSLTRAGEPCG